MREIEWEEVRRNLDRLTTPYLQEILADIREILRNRAIKGYSM